MKILVQLETILQLKRNTINTYIGLLKSFMASHTLNEKRLEKAKKKELVPLLITYIKKKAKKSS